MTNVVAVVVGLVMTVAGLGFAGFLYTVGPPGIETIAIAAGLGGAVGGGGLLVLYLGLTKDDWEEGQAGIHIGGPPR